jgi:hypothetical protein
MVSSAALRFAGAFLGVGLMVTGPAQPAEPVVLTAVQRDSVDRGDLVIRSEARPTSPWPAMTIYVWIDATPEEAVAVFTDYDQHASYIPGMRKAKVSRVIDRASAEVDYTLAVPVFPDEDYTVRNRLSRAGEDYRVDWIMVRASSTRATEGHALFTPYVNQRAKKSGTLLEYYNFVTPGSRLAGLPFIRNRSVHQIGETVKAIARQAEIERAREAAMLPRLTALRSAVAASGNPDAR